MLVCLRPLSTGDTALWRSARDRDRWYDAVRCLCGQQTCRDAELKN